VYGSPCALERQHIRRPNRRAWTRRNRTAGSLVMVSEEAGFTFDTTFFMALAWRTELGFKAPVRAKRDEARRLLAPTAAQYFLHR